MLKRTSALCLLMMTSTANAQSADVHFSGNDRHQLSSGKQINPQLAEDLSVLFNDQPRSTPPKATGSNTNINLINAPNTHQARSLAQTLVAQNTTAALNITTQAAAVDENSIRITSIPFTISQSGAYLLADNMTNTTAGADGITITSGQVTLDLGGFVLSADTIAGDDGIFVSGDRSGIRIINGHIDGWSGDGINADSCDSCLFENLTISNNTQNGLLTGVAAVVKHVMASFNGQDGIDVDASTVVTLSTARENGGNGIQGATGVTVAQSGSFANSIHGIDVGSGGNITNCTTRDNVRFGYELGSASIVLQSSAHDNGENGFQVFFAAILRDNIASFNGSATDDVTLNNGFRASANSYLINNHAYENDGAGIRVISGDSVIENNHIVDNDRAGIETAGAGNFILRNRASGNASSASPLNYSISANNAFGPVIGVAGITDISTITNSDHTYANLEY